MTAGWVVDRLSGSAADLHARQLGPVVGRRLLVLSPARPALVLGSTQPESDVDGAAVLEAGIDLVRRRSGGGAVLLQPGETLWVDVELPRADPLWDDDVGVASHWLGRWWVAALGELGIGGTAHTGGMQATRWSRRICFAGLGPGEVTVGGRKLVGISQRRTRAGARFQCVVHRHWDPVPLVRLLALSPDEREDVASELAGSATGLDADGDTLVAALRRHLPT